MRSFLAVLVTVSLNVGALDYKPIDMNKPVDKCPSTLRHGQQDLDNAREHNRRMKELKDLNLCVSRELFLDSRRQYAYVLALQKCVTNENDANVVRVALEETDAAVRIAYSQNCGDFY